MQVRYRSMKSLPKKDVLSLYRSVRWSSAKKPARLLQALKHSHSVVTAWVNGSLVGLGNAISDGSMVVYYPHLLVSPDFQGQGIGRQIVKQLMNQYRGFHQHVLIADAEAVSFYRKCGFRRAGKTTSMWVFRGKEHG
ncbi:MAG TPA: GNAT family N-acetyltransferase [Burkholderiales bacterium]|nr:GNAT family N-acetyltransferase [Burkholderiales bacterium]